MSAKSLSVQMISLIWACILFLSLTTLSRGGVIECEPNQQTLNGQRCCSLCPPGEGATEACTPVNDTLCRPCQHGRSYSSTSSPTEPCRTCTSCPEFSRVITPCNVTHDTVCECDRGSFFDELVQRCRACDECHVGYGVKRPCGRLQNTVCGRCPDGTYSDRRPSSFCLRCSTCGPSEVTLQPCTAVQNTICVDIPYMAYDPSIPLATQAAATNQKSREDSSPDVIPIFCVLLGLIILGTIIFAIVKARRQKTQAKSTRSSAAFEGQALPLVTDEQTQSQRTCNNAVSIPPDAVTAAGGSDAVKSSTRYETLPLGRRFAVESQLQHSPEAASIFRRLATELGYSVDRVAIRENPGQFRTLLTDWSRSKTSTVGVLAQALANIGRQDIFAVLYHPLTDYMRPQTIGEIV